MSMTSAEIRSLFLNYFKGHGHQIVESGSLIPHNDPTLLFTNAGMVPFKDVFLGHEHKPYTMAVSSQKCVRAGGKHNDLENVGYTARHHTFFEMLGNFSFGDYFKEKAIELAWTFLTKELGLPEEKLWVTVFEEDDEAYQIWSEQVGVPVERIRRIGAADNFWQMGDTGPCGPCTEIFYDHGESIWGGPPGSPEEDGDRYIEIWNLVFMQYNRDSQGQLHPLPKPSVDTGMGLERIAAVMQGVHSNYETDTFKDLIACAARMTGTDDLEAKSLRVIADHIRSCAFLITDGVLPSNEGRGYVLRRIIRRAVRHGHKLGQTELFFSQLIPDLARIMGDAYPELIQKQQQIMDVLQQEEQQFAKTVQRGLLLLEDALEGKKEGDVLDGAIAFKLYDTYGFPLDLTADISREQGIQVDQKGFDQAMDEQRKRAQAASQFGHDYNQDVAIQEEVTFTGYTDIDGSSSIVELYVEGQAVQKIQAGQEAIVVLKATPFYAEGGGQVGDTGFLLQDKINAFEVLDTQKYGQGIGHLGKALADLSIGDTVQTQVDAERRAAIKRHHTATHLLHAALRQQLGEQVTQKGSLVTAERLRFDFAYNKPVTAQELLQLEKQVNAAVFANTTLTATYMSMDDAKASGALALFGEKYDDEVRVIAIGEESVELCGGTHVHATGDIGLFRITSESGIASGVRRIEAVTGDLALQASFDERQQLAHASQLLKADSGSWIERLEQFLEKQKELEQQLAQFQKQAASTLVGSLIEQQQEIAGLPVIVTEVTGISSKQLRDLYDGIKNRLPQSIVLLGLRQDGKVNLLAGVGSSLTQRIKAGELVNIAAEAVGGRGGGRPDMAQAGGSQPEQLPIALENALNAIKNRLNS